MSYPTLSTVEQIENLAIGSIVGVPVNNPNRVWVMEVSSDSTGKPCLRTLGAEPAVRYADWLLERYGSLLLLWARESRSC
jgi:hypothetical protein